MQTVIMFLGEEVQCITSALFPGHRLDQFPSSDHTYGRSNSLCTCVLAPVFVSMMSHNARKSIRKKNPPSDTQEYHSFVTFDAIFSANSLHLVSCIFASDGDFLHFPTCISTIQKKNKIGKNLQLSAVDWWR